MDAAQISRLLAPLVSSATLGAQPIEYISMYIDILLRWNRKINLTAVREPEGIVTRHFGESLFAAEQLLASEDHSLRVIDVGSGAGFPGLPLKIYAPQIRLTLVESNSRKAAFLREVIRALKLADAEVFAGRVEDFSGSGELVTMRAVEKFDRALPAAGRLVQPGARIALLIGTSQVEHAQQGLPDFDWDKPKLIPGSEERVLLVGRNQKNQESNVQKMERTKDSAPHLDPCASRIQAPSPAQWALLAGQNAIRDGSASPFKTGYIVNYVSQ